MPIAKRSFQRQTIALNNKQTLRIIVIAPLTLKNSHHRLKG